MNKVMAALAALGNAVKNNPVLVTALVNFGVFVGGYFGLHVTGAELLYYVGVVTAVLGVLSRALVTPTAKLPAGTVVPPDVSSAPAVVPLSASQGLIVTNVHSASTDAKDVAAHVMGDSKSDDAPRGEGTANGV